jgi:hypothetical protein
MAFTSTRLRTYADGGGRVSVGTFVNALSTDTGGSVDTGIKSLESFVVTFTSHFNSPNPKATITAGSSIVTLVTEGGTSGRWRATGRV